MKVKILTKCTCKGHDTLEVDEIKDISKSEANKLVDFGYAKVQAETKAKPKANKK